MRRADLAEQRHLQQVAAIWQQQQFGPQALEGAGQAGETGQTGQAGQNGQAGLGRLGRPG